MIAVDWIPLAGVTGLVVIAVGLVVYIAWSAAAISMPDIDDNSLPLGMRSGTGPTPADRNARAAMMCRDVINRAGGPEEIA